MKAIKKSFVVLVLLTGISALLIGCEGGTGGNSGMGGPAQNASTLDAIR